MPAMHSTYTLTATLTAIAQARNIVVGATMQSVSLGSLHSFAPWAELADGATTAAAPDD